MRRYPSTIAFVAAGLNFLALLMWPALGKGDEAESRMNTARIVKKMTQPGAPTFDEAARAIALETRKAAGRTTGFFVAGAAVNAVLMLAMGVAGRRASRRSEKEPSP